MAVITLATIATSFLAAVNRLFEHPLIAYFIILFLLLTDASVSGMFGFQGAVGSVVSFMMGFVLGSFGFNIVITSQQLLIIFGFFFPVGLFCFKILSNK